MIHGNNISEVMSNSKIKISYTMFQVLLQKSLEISGLEHASMRDGDFRIIERVQDKIWILAEENNQYWLFQADARDFEVAYQGVYNKSTFVVPYPISQY
jgi:hypothetical protein